MLLKGNSTAPYFVLTAGEKLNVSKLTNNYAGAHLVLSAPTAVIETLIVDGENKDNPATLEISKNSQRTGTQSLTIDALSLQNNSELSIESGVSLTLNSEVTSDHSGVVIAVADGGVLNFEDLDGAKIDAMLDIDAGAVLNVVRGIWTITDGGFNSDRRMQLDGTLVIGGETSQSASLTVAHGIEGSGSGEIKLVNGGSLNLSSSSYALSTELKTNITVESGAMVSVKGGSWSVAEGNKLTLQDGGALSVTGGLTTQLQTENGELTMAGGRLDLLDGSNAKLSYLTITSGENSLTINAGVLELPGSLTVDGGVLETTVSDNGTLRITIGSIDFYPGNFTIGGTDAAATLEFTTPSGTLSTSLFAPETGRFVDEGNAIFKIGQLMLTDGGSLSLKDSSAFEVDSLTLRGDLAFGSGQIRLSGAGGGSELAGDKLTLGIKGSSGKAVLLLGENDGDGSGGTLSTNVTAVNGSVVVKAGTWTLAKGKTLALETGSLLTVGGQNKTATLTIASGATLASAADGNGSDEGVNVLGLGVLEADASALFTIDEFTGDVDLVSGLHKIYVDEGGLLRINLSGDISVSVDSVLARTITTGKGYIEYVGGGVVWSSKESDKVLAEKRKGVICAETIATARAEEGDVELVGGYGASGVQIRNDLSGNIEQVQILNDLTLVGGGALISALDSAGQEVGIEKVVVADGHFLNLGYTGYTDKTGHLMSDVVLGTTDGTGGLAAYGGHYTVTNILAGKDGKGVVNAKSGAQLVVENNIGSADSSVGSITVDDKDASVSATGSIWTQQATLDGGTLQAGESITIAGSLEMTNATTILAQSGDITLRGEAENISGLLEAAQGSIYGADIYGADGALKLEAAGNIEAGSVTANSVKAAGNITLDSLQAVSVSASGLKSTGGVSLKSGSLVLGSGEIGGSLLLDAMKASAETMSVGENLTLTAGSEAEFDTLTVSGDVVATAASLTIGSGTVDGDLTLKGGTTAVFDTLSLLGDIRVGTPEDQKGSTLQVLGALALNGKVLMIDPDWGEAASQVAVESINDAASAEDVQINGGVAVGQNSYVTIGTSNLSWLPEVSGELSESVVNTALGVYRPVQIASGGKLYVDGTLTGGELYNGVDGAYDTAASNSATFASGSLLVVNGKGLGSGTAAIEFETTGTLAVENDARLLIADAVGGQQYTIVANVGNLASAFDGVSYNDAESTGWKGMNLMADSAAIELVGRYDEGADRIVIIAQQQTAGSTFPGLSPGMARAVDDLYATQTDSSGLRWNLADVTADQGGVRLLSRATNVLYLGNNVDAAARTIESAARMAYAGAVPQMARMASDVGVNAVVSRFSLVNPVDGLRATDAEGMPAGRNALGLTLWATPTWQNKTGYNLEAGRLEGGFSGNIGGLAFGADYTFESAVRAGIAVNVGTGYAHSSKDYSRTTNHMDYWGLGVYAGYKGGNFALVADAGFTSSYNELRQDLDAGMNMADLHGNVQTEVWHAGLRAEYRLETSVMDFIPHVGARYTNLHLSGYDIKSEGTALKAQGMSQDIWTFPVGVTFSKSVETDSGRFVRPFLDFTVIAAAGDVKARQDVRFTGLSDSYEVFTQTMDHVTWQGGAGMEIEGENLSAGVNYVLQAGQTGTGHSLFATLRYKF